MTYSMRLLALVLLAFAAQASKINVKTFGARGDGLTDDYDALQAAAAYVCRHPGTTLLFPPGTYRISRYRITGGPSENSVRNIRYTGCRNVTISGYGARIEVQGDFRRTADLTTGPVRTSYKNGVIPFEIINSSDFTIQGFELNGSADHMTRDPGVGEGANAGILTTRCRRYILQDIYVHHFPTDGITLGGNSEIADQDATLRRITAANNGRQGLSVIQVRAATISSSIFKLTGRTGGAYGSHAPAAGVDVEPVRAPPQEDLKTGALVFDRCRFEDNLGAQFVSGWPDKVDTITVQNSYISAPHPDGERCAFLNVAAQAVTRANTFDLASPHAVCLSLISPGLYQHIGQLTYANNLFRLGHNLGMATAIQPAAIAFIGNTVEVRATAPDPTTMRLDYLNRVEGNRFFVAAPGWAGSHSTIVYEKGATTVAENTYSTDLTGSRYDGVYYGPGIACEDENFPSANFKPTTRCRSAGNRSRSRAPATAAK
jgi:hypothetical protein